MRESGRKAISEEVGGSEVLVFSKERGRNYLGRTDAREEWEEKKREGESRKGGEEITGLAGVNISSFDIEILILDGLGGVSYLCIENKVQNVREILYCRVVFIIKSNHFEDSFL